MSSVLIVQILYRQFLRQQIACLILVHNVEKVFQIPNRVGTESRPVIKSRGPNRQFSVVLVMVPVSFQMFTVFAILGMQYVVRSKISVSGDLIMNIPRTPRAVQSASTNPS